MAQGGNRRTRDADLARAAAAQKAKEAELQNELIRETRTEKKARITQDLFEEEKVKDDKVKRKIPKKKSVEGEGEKESRADDDRPTDALHEVAGEEAAPDDEFDEKGVPIEPFNLRAEREEGYFDKDGNYVRKRGDSPVRDAWLDEVDEQLTKDGKAKALSKARVDDDDAPAAPFDLNRTRRAVLRFLRLADRQDTTLAALRRFKAEGRMADFNALTEAADLCVQNGVYEIYSETVRQLLGALTADEADEKVWEYRALGAADDAPTHGPFSSAQMGEWHSAGYFQGDTVMLVRRTGSPTFRRSDELDFERLLLPKERPAQGT